MNINALKREMKKLEKFFVDPSGEIYTATELHEKLAKYDVFKYVAMSKIYVKNKHIFENAIYISELLNLKLEIY